MRFRIQISYLLLVFLVIFCFNLAKAQIPGLEVESNGILLPRLSSTQRDAISTPETGLMIFNTTKNCLELYNGSDWFSLCNQDSPSPNTLLGGSDIESVICIQQTSDGGYIFVGTSSSSLSGDVSDANHGFADIWVVKIDEFHNIIWNKLLGGTANEIASCIQQTSDGGYIVAGSTFSSASGDVTGVNHGLDDYWIIKLDGTGNIVWNKILGGSANDVAKSIRQTSDGGYIVAGYSRSSMNGNVTNINHGQADFWIIKLDATGNITWHKLLGGNKEDQAYSIQQTSDSGYIVAGFSRSSANGDVSGVNRGVDDYWIVKLDGLGNIVWQKLLGGNSIDSARSIVQTSDGGYIVAGYSLSTLGFDVSDLNHGGYDFWIVKLNSSGNITWDKLLGGDGVEIPSSVIQTADDGYILAGYSSSSSNGDVSDGNHGLVDYWILKLSSIGQIIWNKLFGGNNDESAGSVCQTVDGDFTIGGGTGSSSNGDVTGANHGQNDCWVIKINASGNIIK